MSEGNISVRDSLQASVDALSADAAPEPIVAPVEAATEAPAVAETIQAEASDGAPVRDEKGRFAPKDPAAVAEAAPALEAETATPEEKEAPSEPIRIPPSLPAAVKAKFANLDPDVRQAFEKLEGTVQTAKAEWEGKGKRLNRYDEILGPHLDKWRLNGLDEFSGVQTLLAAQNILESNPVQGLVHIARSYGVTSQQLTQALGLQQANGPQPGQEGQPTPTVAPDMSAVLNPVLSEVQALKARLEQSDQASEAAKLADARATVASFAAKPENMYFDNVREDVAAHLQANPSLTLEQAYQKAIWASDEIRPLLLQAQAAESSKKAVEEAARQKARAAQQSAGSVTGAPAPGATALSAGPRPSLREELAANFREATASI